MQSIANLRKTQIRVTKQDDDTLRGVILYPLSGGFSAVFLADFRQVFCCDTELVAVKAEFSVFHAMRVGKVQETLEKRNPLSLKIQPLIYFMRENIPHIHNENLDVQVEHFFSETEFRVSIN